MKSKNCYTGINPTLVEQVRFQAQRLKKKGCSEDIEDIEQELFVWSQGVMV